MTNRSVFQAVINLGMVPLGLSLTTVGCGYEPVYGGERPQTRLTVHAAPASTPHTEAVAAVLTGTRRSLSAAGVLKAGESYPKVFVEVVRVDEQAAGMSAVERDGELQPSGRGSAVAVVARAWVEEVEHGPHQRDTGDVRRSATFASGATASTDQLAYEEALRSAGHAVGQSLGRRILGEPEPTLAPL